MNFIDEVRDRLLLRFPRTAIKERIKGTDTIIEYIVKIPKNDESVITDVIHEVEPIFPWLNIKTKRTKKGAVKITAEPKTDDIPRSTDQVRPIPITFYVGDDVISLAMDGDTFAILKNGDILETDFPSPGFALGAMVKYVAESMISLENDGSIPSSPNSDLVAGMAELLVDLPDVSKEAKNHFIKFYEMVTLKDFASTVKNED